MKIYALSGLGTDGRIFSHLTVDHEIIPIKWAQFQKEDTLAVYASRLLSQIETDEPFALMGVSFGGMLAVELAKVLQPEKVILISSAATHHELPTIARIANLTSLHRVLPSRIYKPPTWASFLGFPMDRPKREIAKGIIRDMDHVFIKWALGAIVTWRNDVIPKNMVHIHGRLDPIIPLKKRMNAEVIGLGHFIVLKEAKKISGRINRIIE